LFDLNVAGKWDEAEAVRQMFIPLEDLRDSWGPARVLHAATEQAHICKTGPIRPYISEISADQLAQLGPVARQLRDAVMEGRTA
jgi:dihydrodipicolinate synthase/N-acetylneuraminate lyase